GGAHQLPQPCGRASVGPCHRQRGGGRLPPRRPVRQAAPAYGSVGALLRKPSAGVGSRSDPGGAVMSRQEEYDKRAKHGGKGLSTRFSDNAFWLPHDIDEALIEALVALDRSGGTNKKPLIELLRSRGYVYLADLLDRYQLKRKQGGRQTPLYDRTDIHRRL